MRIISLPSNATSRPIALAAVLTGFFIAFLANSPAEAQAPNASAPTAADSTSVNPPQDSAKQEPFKPESARADAETRPDTAASTGNAKESTDPKEGHSVHGEVFNEGPRQRAYRMDGVGKVRFPVTTTNEEARRFIEQGVAQLHGFWYFESERSFRQAAMLDPECATAYWGMAMSNRGNEKRAKGFIAEAIKRKDKTSRRELLLIEAFDRYINAKSEKDEEKKARGERYVADLEDILIEFPTDIETKAFLCEFFWSGKRDGLDMPSYLSVDSLLTEILNEEPLHPAHHYRIHLWDGKKPELAVRSSALCGLSAPAIAHMWHMPGHIYSRLHRYHDAVYQQEASARVDHKHMMTDRVMPDQIHNFAHNNEWCIRNMMSIGRAHDAEELAFNMLSMPRHPKYNHIGKSGSFKYSRERLIDVLQTFELYDRLAALRGTSWMEDTGDAEEDLRRDRAIGAAFAALGKTAEATEYRTKIQTQLDAKKKEQSDAVAESEKKAVEAKSDEKAIEKAKKDASGKFDRDIKRFEKAMDEINGQAALVAGDTAKALELLKNSDASAELLARLHLKVGQNDEAIRKIAESVKAHEGEVLPLATETEILFAAGKKEEAKASFEKLRKISATIDLDVPPIMRLAAISKELGFPDDWRLPLEVPSDLGAKPNLDSLGPFRWSPSEAPDWSLVDVDMQKRSLADYRGRPVIVVFYLGYGCLHCAEQLQAIAKKFDAVKAAGFDVIAISTDKQENLKRAYESYEGGFPFPLVTDHDLNVFREYRCYDDFEKAALHGTFIVDPSGKVRWQDISYEPFNDVDFLIKEGTRLLSLDPT
jgi:peroxiredoxin